MSVCSLRGDDYYQWCLVLHCTGPPPPSPRHQTWDLTPTTDIWWPNGRPVQTCSLDDPFLQWHLVVATKARTVCKRAVRILLHFYHPQWSCGKVMFSQASVILFTGEGACVACLPGHAPSGMHAPPGTHAPCWMVNARALRIPLECNLVSWWFFTVDWIGSLKDIKPNESSYYKILFLVQFRGLCTCRLK